MLVKIKLLIMAIIASFMLLFLSIQTTYANMPLVEIETVDTSSVDPTYATPTNLQRLEDFMNAEANQANRNYRNWFIITESNGKRNLVGITSTEQITVTKTGTSMYVQRKTPNGNTTTAGMSYSWLGKLLTYTSPLLDTPTPLNDLVVQSVAEAMVQPSSIAVGQITVSEITATSALVSWNIPSENPWTSIEMSVFKPAQSESALIFTAGKPSTSMRINGLNAQTGYNISFKVKNGTLTSTATLKSFFTLSSKYNVQLYMGNQPIMENSTYYIHPLTELMIYAQDYTKVELYSSGALLDTHNLSTRDETYSVTPDKFSAATIDASGNMQLEVRAYKSGGIYDKKTYVINTQLMAGGGIGDPGTRVTGTEPHAPTPPDSAWDIVGWLKYLLGWVVYVVETFTWLLGQLGNMITSIATTATGFSSVLTSFFNFLPPQVTALFTMGIVMSILLRVLKR